MLLTTIRIIYGLAIFGLFAPIAHGHHSFAATYTTDLISVDGVVDEYKFTNPHASIHFIVTDEQGLETRWVSEGLSATVLRRRGWSKDSVVKGDHIRITGNTSRNGSPMLSTNHLDFIDPVDGTVIDTADNRIAAKTDDNATHLTPMQLADGRPNLAGTWQRIAQGRPDDPSGAPLNDIGKALQDSFDPINDPQVQCQPPGLVRQAAATPYPVRLSQYPDRVVIAYEEYGHLRTIYVDSPDVGDNQDVGDSISTHLGQSKARYQGQKLIIETTHLLGNLTGTNGNALSDQTTTTETYYRKLDADGLSSLAMEMVIRDPGHLNAPWTLSWQKFYIDDYQFIEVDCEPPISY